MSVLRCTRKYLMSHDSKSLNVLTSCVCVCDPNRQVCLFLKRGATQNDEDEDGQEPLSIAVQQANADIVTLYVTTPAMTPAGPRGGGGEHSR